MTWYRTFSENEWWDETGFKATETTRLYGMLTLLK